MDPVATVVDKLKEFAESTRYFAHSLLSRRKDSDHRSPIEILKRLQREAFSDIMKLRDRQDKVERIITLNKSSKGNPFQEASTHVRGKVDVLGGFFIMDGVDVHKCDVLQRSGIRTGVDARFTFETAVREKDIFLAEFTASEKGQGDSFGGPLSLSKVFYGAHFRNWFSAVAIPMGARCRDVEVATDSHRERSLTDYSEFGPPLLNQHSDSAIGITVRKSNVVASLAQFVSGLRTQVHPAGITLSLSTFGRVVWQLSRRTKLSLLGMHQVYRSSSQRISLGALALPISAFKQNRISEISAVEDSPTSQEGHLSDRSIALMVNSELDENARIGGWIETKNSDPGYFQWAVTMCDTPEDEFGWGLTLGGSLQSRKTWGHFQVETYLNLNFGKRFKLQPALVHVMDESTQVSALLLRSIMETDHSHSSLTTANGAGINIPDSWRPTAWASVVRGNSEQMSSPIATAVSAAPGFSSASPGQALGSRNSLVRARVTKPSPRVLMLAMNAMRVTEETCLEHALKRRR